MTMALVAQPKTWATSKDDWEMHREAITTLYWKDDKKLKEVVELMAQKHNFHATERMYKERIKQWGLTKYKTRDKPQKQRGKAVVAVPHVGPKPLKRLLTRQTRPGSSSMVVQSTKRSTSPLSICINSPDILKATERCMQAALSYTQNRFETKVWDLSDRAYNWGDDVSFSWWQSAMLAAGNLVKQPNSPKHFNFLNKCLDQYRSMLAKPDACLLWTTYMFVLKLAEVGPELADTTTRFLAGLCSICLGPYHPFTLLWSSVHSMGILEARHMAMAVMNAQFDVTTAYADPANEFQTISRVHIARNLYFRNLISYTAAEAIHKTIIDDLRKAERPGNDQDATWTNWSRLSLTSVQRNEGKYEDAFVSLEEIGDWLHSGDHGHVSTWQDYLEVKAPLLEDLGRYSESTDVFLERVDYCRKIYGPHARRTMKAMGDLQDHYQRINDLQAAKRAEQEFDAKYQELVETADNLRLNEPLIDVAP